MSIKAAHRAKILECKSKLKNGKHHHKPECNEHTACSKLIVHQVESKFMARKTLRLHISTLSLKLLSLASHFVKLFLSNISLHIISCKLIVTKYFTFMLQSYNK